MRPPIPDSPLPEPPMDEIGRRDKRIKNLEKALTSLGNAVVMGTREDVMRATVRAGEVLRESW